MAVAPPLPPWVRLRCPDHGTPLACARDGCSCERAHRFAVRNGIPQLLPSDLPGPDPGYVRWIRDYYRVPFSRRQLRIGEARWARFVALTVPEPPVLDVGCGRADRSARFPAGAYVGVDPIDPVAAGMVPAPSGPMVVGHGERLPFADAQFGSVMLWAVLDHVADRAALLRECARVLRPGGRLCVMSEVVGRRGNTAAGLARWVLSRLRTGDVLGLIAVARFTLLDPRSRAYLTPLTVDGVLEEVARSFSGARWEVDDGHALILGATR